MTQQEKEQQDRRLQEMRKRHAGKTGIEQQETVQRDETVQQKKTAHQDGTLQQEIREQVPEQETIRIKYHSDEIKKLEYIDGKSDWIDLRSAENVKMKQGEFRLVSLGVSMQLPKGYEAVIVPRSSTYKNFGIIQTNHMGVIDESYCGDKDIWRMPVLAMRDTQIQVNDRICQFRIQKHQPKLVFEETDSLGSPNRGGFGSTGKQ